MMEIVDYAHKLWSLEDGYARMLKNKAKKQFIANCWLKTLK